MWFDCSEERFVHGTGPWALVQPGQNCTVCCISTALYLHIYYLLSMERRRFMKFTLTKKLGEDT